ncbi:hypothetical protein GC173_10090 [bacterium]|nr:hypothetical protein [bacterium]
MIRSSVTSVGRNLPGRRGPFLRKAALLLMLCAVGTSCTTVHRNDKQRLRTVLEDVQGAKLRPVIRLDTSRKDLLPESKLPVVAYWEKEQQLLDEFQYTATRKREKIKVDWEEKKLEYVALDVLMLRWAVAPIAWIYFPIKTEDAAGLYTMPPIDFFGRIFGDGLRRQQDDILGVDQAPERLRKADPPRGGMEGAYFLNIADWFGWFVPFYPIYGVETFSEETPAGTPTIATEPSGYTRWVEARPMTPEEFSRYQVSINGVPVTDPPTVTAEADSNRLRIDLRDALVSTVGRDDLIKITLSEPKASEALVAFAVAARDIGVSWEYPQDGARPTLVTRVVDRRSKSDVLELGKEYTIQFEIENTDKAFPARNLTTTLTPKLGASLGSRMSIQGHRIDRLDPGQKWTISYPVRMERASQTASGGAFDAAFELKIDDHYKNSWTESAVLGSVPLPDPANLVVVAAATARMAEDRGQAGVVEKGDRVSLGVTVRNTGASPGEGCRMDVESLSIPGVGSLEDVTVSPSYLGSIPPGGQVLVYLTGTVPANVVASTPLSIDYKLSVKEGDSTRADLSAQAGLEVATPTQIVRTEQVSADVERLNLLLADANKQLESQASQLETMRSDRATLQNDLSRARAEQEETRRKLQDQQGKAVAKNEAIKDELAKANETIREVTARLTVTREELDRQAQAANKSVEVYTNELVATSQAAEKKAEALSEERNALEQEILRLRESALATAREQEQKVADLESRARQADEKLQRAEAERQEALLRSNDLLAQLTDAKATITKLSAEMKELSGTSAANEEKLAGARAELAAKDRLIAEQLGAYAKASAYIRADLDKKRIELASLQETRSAVSEGLRRRRANSRALIIGVNDYSQLLSGEHVECVAQKWNLNFAAGDAQRIKALITDPNSGIVDEGRVTMLLDKDATSAKITEYFDELFDDARSRKSGINPGEGLLFVYFAGHGFDNSLLLHSSRWEPPQSGCPDQSPTTGEEIRRAFPLATLKDKLLESGYRQRIVMIDACDMGKKSTVRPVNDVDLTTIPANLYAQRGVGLISRAVGRPGTEQTSAQLENVDADSRVVSYGTLSVREDFTDASEVLSEGVGIFYASQNKQPALELSNLRAGLFTHCVELIAGTRAMRALSEDGQEEEVSADGDDGILTFGELVFAVDAQMKSASSSLGMKTPLSPVFDGPVGFPGRIPLSVGPSIREARLKEEIEGLEALMRAGN